MPTPPTHAVHRYEYKTDNCTAVGNIEPNGISLYVTYRNNSCVRTSPTKSVLFSANETVVMEQTFNTINCTGNAIKEEIFIVVVVAALAVMVHADFYRYEKFIGGGCSNQITTWVRHLTTTCSATFCENNSGSYLSNKLDCPSALPTPDAHTVYRYEYLTTDCTDANANKQGTQLFMIHANNTCVQQTASTSVQYFANATVVMEHTYDSTDCTGAASDEKVFIVGGCHTKTGTTKSYMAYSPIMAGGNPTSPPPPPASNSTGTATSAAVAAAPTASIAIAVFGAVISLALALA
ncbi:uncharacterized protein AMSG_12382 [Thecamonas trahens ATCC 50062]|uniref:Uncharacterized protein n=1 Tax=Thecamonas trahens ATCC 50062 TaxID=461836 RepID=A0A0L0DSY3_THETB|nr:hypothetical protein AMSG_12382 [Thecamonas trahens ATCC 50062]KNC55121.1 hypothetical protein AMSG_12382 [Thecamonas trahens ATCC 50062]|eukprot:XP_013753321.1 hypothetical protein AMSG_12382 [Thecamonas trahens ATCC 50062]